MLKSIRFISSLVVLAAVATPAFAAPDYAAVCGKKEMTYVPPTGRTATLSPGGRYFTTFQSSNGPIMIGGQWTIEGDKARVRVFSGSGQITSNTLHRLRIDDKGACEFQTQKVEDAPPDGGKWEAF